MRILRYILLAFPAYTASLDAQNILNQFSIPYSLAFTLPSFETGQFARPDGSGGMIFFHPPDNSLHRFDPTGKELWSATVSLGTAQGVVDSMAVAPDGIYVGGDVTGALPGQTNAGSYDIVTFKYDLTGKILWSQQFGTANDDSMRDVVVSPNGIYVLGVTDGANRIFIRRSDNNGSELWTRYFNDPAAIDIIGAAADSTGLYFAGMNSTGSYNILRKFDSEGNDLWTYTANRFNIVQRLAADEKGVYVLFLENGGSLSNSVLRLNGAGSLVWTRDYAISYTAGPIVADATGFYLAGTTDVALPGQCYAGGGDVFVIRADTNGNPLWTREFGTSQPESPVEIAIGATSIDLTVAGVNNVSMTNVEKLSAAVSDSKPTIRNECVLNAASYVGGAVAPGEIVTILGLGLGPKTLAQFQIAPNGQIATALSGTQVLFDDQPVPLLYVFDQQVSAIVPYGVAAKSDVNVQVLYNGVKSSGVTMPVVNTRLGIFSLGATGTGQAAIVNQDGSVNSSSNPAPQGSVISIYATGGGLPSPLDADDTVTGSSISAFKFTPYVRLISDGSCDTPYFGADVLYYGEAPQSVPGLVQINARLPQDVPTGINVPLYVGGAEQVLTIAIR
jgi:uncharacterized protein (TIGR03437 family)